MTPLTNRTGEGYKVLTGKETQRYFIKNIQDKWFLEEKYLSESDIDRAKRKKVVVQDIVAHVTKPVPHIKLTATIDDQQQFCLNTVMCFSEKKEVPNEFLVGLINSSLMSFFFYYFIYNQAIRTMHFMPGYADKTPIPINLTKTHSIVQLVDKILSIKKQNPSTDTSELENQIDQLVYLLYELTDEEIKIIENT
jgi:adenine-specific DNA-methyltransferase